MNSELIKIALRHGALWLGDVPITDRRELGAPAAAFAASLAEKGYELDSHALAAANAVSPTVLADVVRCIDEVYGIGLNWAPLVKAWQTPTGESRLDHIVTLFANLFPTGDMAGTVLPCGHFIPDGTFPLERYNGCPFCGTPFELSKIVYKGTGSHVKVLTLWQESDFIKLRDSLVYSPLPLNATQWVTLLALLKAYGLPQLDRNILVDNTLMIAAYLEDRGEFEKVVPLLPDPAILLRYLWYRHTDNLRITPPAAIVARKAGAYRTEEARAEQAAEARLKLKLYYDRAECRRYASLLNSMSLSTEAMCELMNPRRGMWVRFIRALRLSEFARKPGYGKLAELLDRFYRKDYDVWAGRLAAARERRNPEEFFAMLESRPGLFARSLFASMLWFGADVTLDRFKTVTPALAPRLLLSLANAADIYFKPEGDTRRVELPGGVRVEVPVNKLLSLYTEDARSKMAADVKRGCLEGLSSFFASQPHEKGATVYIAPELFAVPVPLGDRSNTVSDTDMALPGQRFKVEGNAVRLFLQWGKGLPAQHLDMDLSCRIAYADGGVAECAYYSLTLAGATHSGDIQFIPDMVGTAEYIELDLDELRRGGAQYVTFTCNAYTDGSLQPNLMVGWMDSANPMEVSDATGVAYDPSTVSHMVRISAKDLSKGLVFGVLDVEAGEIIWLEMPFDGRSLRSLDTEAVTALLRRLAAKASIGELLRIMANAQGLRIVDSPEGAGRVYSSWTDAMNILG